MAGKYVKKLSDIDQQKVSFAESNHIYLSGDGTSVNAIYSAKNTSYY